jgi:tight adherence protein B
MSASLAWLSVGVAVGCLPAVSADRRRTWQLAVAGRLDAPPERPPRVWRVVHGRPLAVVATGVSTATRAGWVVGAAVGVGVAALWSTGSAAVRRRQLRASRCGVIAAVRLIASELDAGSRPAEAVAAAVVVAPQLGAVLTALAAAEASGADVCAAAAGSFVAPVGRAWQVGLRAGAPIADVLRRAADDLAAAEDASSRLDAILAGPRASALFVGALPVLGVGLGVALGAHPLETLTGPAWGRVVCAMGIVLDALGLHWTNRLIARAEPP